MQVSVIVPTYNRPEALLLCLKSLARQSRLPDEVLVADDGSAEATRLAIEQFAASTACPFPLKHVWQEDCGFRKPQILNETVRTASGDYLVVIDGDCMAHRDFVLAHCQAAESGAILGGKRVELGEKLTAKVLASGVPVISLTLDLVISSLQHGSRKVEEAIVLRNPLLRQLAKRDLITDDGIWGCNFSVARDLFYAINGCDEDFVDGSVEDNDLGIRVLNSGGKVKSVRGLAIVFHLWHPASWGFGNVKNQHNMKILRRRIALREPRCVNGIVRAAELPAAVKTSVETGTERGAANFVGSAGERCSEKVLLINNDKGWSGGQEHLKDLAGQLLQLGVEIQFVVRRGSRSDSRFRELGVPVHPLPGHGLGDITALVRMVRLLRHEQFDIISVNREHDLFLAGLAWRLAFPLRKKGKLIMSYHTATSRRQTFLGSADAILCISEHVRNKLLLGNPAATGRVSIVYYGISPGAPPENEKFNRNRERRFFKGHKFPLIGMVGEFWKNQGELVRMIPTLQQTFPEIRIVFVGDNTDEALLTPIMALIRSLGVEDAVIFTGRVPREQIPDIFYDFDLSVTTHRNEGFGIVHLESLAAGTPVVTYDEGGMVDIFRGQEVGKVVTGGAAEFSAAVTALLQDDAQRFSMGKAGRELVERRYSLQVMGERYFQFYRQIAG